MRQTIDLTPGNLGYRYKKAGMRFSQIELQHLLIAWAAISFAFANLLGGLSIASFVIAGLTAGVGFILHELAHKFTAQRYGCIAEFRADFGMLGLAVLMSFLGFIFAAPGAVMILGRINKKQNGIISLAGPATNLVVALAFLALGLSPASPLLKLVFDYGFTINAWLGLFNMIPVGNFDGRKIFEWNKAVYGLTAVAALLLTFGRNLLF